MLMLWRWCLADPLLVKVLVESGEEYCEFLNPPSPGGSSSCRSCKMFFEVEMRRLVVVEPGELGSSVHTQRAMLRRLLKDVDAERCSEEHGYYVTVTTLEDVSEGTVRSGSGSIVFWVKFKCIVFRLFRNEVIEAVVSSVLHTGFWAACGPAMIYIPRTEMDGFEFRQGASEESNIWRDASGSLISANTIVRLRVVVTRWEPKDRMMRTLGSLNGDLLGHIPEDPSF